MSETVLDDTTGLPALPNGQWWEVRKYEQRYSSAYGWSHATPDGYEVCVVTRWVTPAHTERGDHWWKPSRRVPEKVESKVLFRKQITGPAKFAAWRSRLDSSFPTYVGKDIIEPADVLKAAMDILDDIQASKESASRKKASDALVGPYPPKKL